MSPEQIDAATNAVAAAYYTAKPYVPGALLALAVWAFVYACRLIRRAWRNAGAAVAELLDRRQWQHSVASEQPADECAEMRRLGDWIACEQIMRATEAWEEDQR